MKPGFITRSSEDGGAFNVEVINGEQRPVALCDDGGMATHFARFLAKDADWRAHRERLVKRKNARVGA